ncbi:MAG: serine/threonine-protein kinase [Acidobacteria bacterium]|nr:serine/threonine-protein kinase [Acidobacteriota bacterium]
MIGRTLGHYRIESKLGEGGMGAVYKARDLHLDRAVAIKVLSADVVANPERKKRFVQEAKAASALNHPNIIHIYDIDTGDGVDFIAMEYVAGHALDHWIGRKGLNLRESLKCAVQIADALAKAHAAGIVHRDLKPANVMVSEEGLVKVLDFGLAKLMEAPEADEQGATQTISSPRTEEGTILGTISYMSPEQAEGKKVDARSDIFSFGAVLYEMITGRRAFQGESKVSTLSAILHKEPKPIGEIVEGVPGQLQWLVSHCLRKSPERRFQGMADVKVALEEMKEESESGASGLVELKPRRASRRWIWAAAAVLAVSVIGGAFWLRSSRPGREAPALRVVPLTSFPGREKDPALSPDGRQVAYSWNGEKQDNFDIYVKLIDAGPPLRLTTNPAEDSSPAWSPDGRYIAFLRSAAGANEILMVPALGGPERKLAPAWVMSGLSWSPDGKFLAFPDQTSPQEPSAIFSLSIETGEKRRLTSPPAQSYGDLIPAFSPDGRTLAFDRFLNFGNEEIWLVPVGNGAPQDRPRRLASVPGINGLAWTPDGGSLVYGSWQTGLRRISASGGAPARLTAGGENASQPSLAQVAVGPGGRPALRLAYVQSLHDSNIYRVAAAGASARKGAPEKLIASTRQEDEPQISPDGKRIVFSSDRSGSLEIWVSDSEGRNPVQLTSFGGPPAGSPRWAPDSRRIAFDCTKEGHSDIYVVSADGGLPRRLGTDNSEKARPSWSRDGKWIYFSSKRTGPWQICKMPAEGGPAVQLTKKGGHEPYESADGKFVYYAMDTGPGIWRVPVEGSSGAEEAKVLEQGRLGAWAVAEQGIYLLQAGKAGPEIQLFSFATRRLGQVVTLPNQAEVAGDNTHLAVSPGARWFLYVQNDLAGSNIMLVDNFR